MTAGVDRSRRLFDIYKLEVAGDSDNVAVARLDETTRSIAPRARNTPRSWPSGAHQCPAAAGAWSHRLDRSRSSRQYLKKHGYKQIDFGNENAMEKLYAAAPRASRRSWFARADARFHEQEAYIVAEAGVPARSRSRPTWRAAVPHQAWRSLEMRIMHETAGSPTSREGRQDRTHQGRRRRFRDIVLMAEDVVEIEPAKARSRRRPRTGRRPLHHGSERHESRRIDNQLRGRSGRRAIPGARNSSCRWKTI